MDTSLWVALGVVAALALVAALVDGFGRLPRRRAAAVPGVAPEGEGGGCVRSGSAGPAPEQYGRLRVCTGDLGAADWLTEPAPERVMCTVAGVVAAGFSAYARVLHPASLDGRPVPWVAVAAARGREVGPLTAWHELLGTDVDPYEAFGLEVPGLFDEAPSPGPTPPWIAEALIPVLARHTGTPDRCWFGLWDGYGGFDFSRFPMFETPGREKVLLSGALADAATAVVELEECAELPDQWWPQDRAWCLGGDVDLVSTYVGGSEELVAELLAHPGLEAHRVGPGDRVG
ncbi:hypothetical protein QNO07_10180 [Streptomyces sp. 549]|uniref:hypothetical protein n=1 Tax=Streptomyces sp. 549 TaxID=3049076 RepID=UPI0024C34D5E|nr:hypothetical protein [Streptomyces sp. 549]MDK1473782.1 hypothetical protein [Streptomyces sp. 549]